MAQGQFVLENRRGQVVRTLQWSGSKLSVVYRADTRRVEPYTDLEPLDEAKIPYEILAEVTPQEVKRAPVKLADAGYIKWLPEVEKVSPSARAGEDAVGTFRETLKWTAGVQLALLLLILLIGHFTYTAPQAQEPERVVKIMPRFHAPIVNPITHPTMRPKQVVRAVVKKHPVHTVSQVNPRHQTRAKTQVALNRLGALSVLGQSDAKQRGGGLQLNAIETSRGPGLGGAQGSGGVQTSAYAKGLVGAPLGPQARADGAGGYGTRGKGGGHAGYGAMSLVGSSSATFEPVERDAIIEGGLDREQIAEVIQRHLGQIRFCYEKGLQLKPGLAGRVSIRFFIGGNGYVNSASVSNTSLHADEVESCIVGHLKGWKFPEPRGGVVVKVTYPFVLKRV